MGMIGNYLMVREEIIEEIKSGRLLASDFLYSDDYSIGTSEHSLNIDKSWYAIHFALTGEILEELEFGLPEIKNNNPLSKIVVNCQQLCDEDVGYGPPMYLSVAEVKDVNIALQSISKEDFRSKFDFSEMIKNAIYPIIDGEDMYVFFEYCLEYFVRVKEFYAKASKENMCIIFYIN